MSPTDRFSDLLVERLDAAYRVLEEYSKDPSEGNIHRMNDAVYGLDAAYHVLPKSLWTKKASKMLSAYGRLLLMNNAVIYHGMLLDKLYQYGYDPESSTCLLLRKHQLEMLSKALDVALEASMLKRPKTKTPKTKTNIPGKRFKKRVSKLIDKLNGHIKNVMSDGDDTEEFDRLDTTARLLQNVLALRPKESYVQLAARLEQLLEIINIITDCDSFVWYMEDNKKDLPNFADMLVSEKNKRGTVYAQLVQMFGDAAR